MKIGRLDESIVQESVEYGDALEIAKREDLPIQEVMEKARHLWRLSKC